MHKKSFKRLFLALRILSDIFWINLAFVIAYAIRFKLGLFQNTGIPQFEYYYGTLFTVTVVMLAVFNIIGLYKEKQEQSFAIDEIINVFVAVSVGIVLIMSFTFLYREFSYSRLLVGFAWLIGVFTLSISRYIIWRSEMFAKWNGYGGVKVAIIGPGTVAEEVALKIKHSPGWGLKIAGFITDKEDSPLENSHFENLGSVNDFSDVVRKNEIEEIIIVNPYFSRDRLAKIANYCDDKKVGLRIIPDFFEIVASNIEVNYLDGLPLISLRESPLTPWNRIVKRVTDIIVSIFFLLILSPLLIITALLIKMTSKGPIIYKQVRVGLNEKVFHIHKFRSMYQDAEQRLEELRQHNEAEGHIFKIKNDPRITPVGRFIRRFSIDELPQLFNVLIGEMSLVGPRPPLPREVTQYNDWHKKRLHVRPGITGLWQVSGRSTLPFDEMVRLDLYYIEHWSLWTDFKIIVQTIPTVIFARGAY